MKKVFIFRHGETEYNRTHRFQGHLDIPLNSKGIEQAKLLIPPLSQQGIEAILSSDLSRSIDTAKIITTAMSIPLFQNPCYREAMLGQAEGLTVDEIKIRFGDDLMRLWRSSRPEDSNIAYPGGETGQQVLARVLPNLEQFLNTSSFQRIGLSTHGGVIRRLIYHFSRGEMKDVPITNGLLYELDWDGRNWKIMDFMAYNPRLR